MAIHGITARTRFVDEAKSRSLGLFVNIQPDEDGGIVTHAGLH
jgi:hypothetical protein